MADKTIAAATLGDTYANLPTTAGTIAVQNVSVVWDDATSTDDLMVALEKAKIAILDYQADK